jgi:hypothetical protein
MGEIQRNDPAVRQRFSVPNFVPRTDPDGVGLACIWKSGSSLDSNQSNSELPVPNQCKLLMFRASNLPKLDVAGSIPVSRSIFLF